MSHIKRLKIETFTIFEAGSNQVFLEMGPRYNPPQDDTTVLRVGHKTVDSGGISVLLEQGDLLILQASLELGHQWNFAGLQTMAQLYQPRHERQELTIWWKGSGRARTFHITRDQADSMAAWISDALVYGWTGWKSGVTE